MAPFLDLPRASSPWALALSVALGLAPALLGCGEPESLIAAFPPPDPVPDGGAPLDAGASGRDRDVWPAPAALEFGSVPPGRERSRPVLLVPSGPRGRARILSATVEGPDADAFHLATPAPPWEVSGSEDPGSLPFTVDVVAAPREPRPVTASLRLDRSRGPPLQIPLRADGRGPPRLTFSPASLQISADQRQAELTFRNAGESDLQVHLEPLAWSGPSITAPSTLTLAPGARQVAKLQVADEPAGRWLGFVSLRTNDATNPQVEIPLEANRQPRASGFTIDLVAKDGSNAAFIDPWRADLEARWASAATVGAEASRLELANGGSVSWTGAGAPARGQRIVGLGPLPSGRYELAVHYRDDCRAVPAPLLAGALGVALDALLATWTGGAPAGGAVLGGLLSEACVRRGDLQVDLRVRFGPRDVAAPNARLPSRGQSWVAGSVVVEADGQLRWEGPR